MSKRVVIAGASGFIGRHLTEHLSKAGYEVIALVRSGSGASKWDGKTLGTWAELLEGAEAVINLAGSPIQVRWTSTNRAEILSSRVLASTAIGQAIAGCKVPPKVWINASAIGVYGNRGDQELTEISEPGNGFLADTCRAWETASKGASLVRIGIVLGTDGGALPTLLKLTKGFLGGAVGHGDQWMSWIHIDDLCRQFVWLVTNGHGGVFNGVAPTPVRNAEFMKELRHQLGRPWSPPAPVFGIKLVEAVAGIPSDLVLDSAKVLPKAALDNGFQFEHPTLSGALRDLLRK